jgi:hypothetical protein
MARYAAIAAWATPEQRPATAARPTVKPAREESQARRSAGARIVRIAMQLFSARS